MRTTFPLESSETHLRDTAVSQHNTQHHCDICLHCSVPMQQKIQNVPPKTWLQSSRTITQTSIAVLGQEHSSSTATIKIKRGTWNGDVGTNEGEKNSGHYIISPS